MAHYDNPEIPEGINVSPTHPLMEFAILLAGISGAVIVVVLVLNLMAGYLVRFVPFPREQALLSQMNPGWLHQAQSASDLQKQQYLQTLADRLSIGMDLPADMNISVHYSGNKMVNAMATLGGHIVVFQGLINVLPSENALAMVLAHEIAHIRHRHPIVALGRGFAVAMAVSSLSGVGDGLMQQWVGSMGVVTAISFSRAQESAADADALQALYRLYGHTNGAEAFFAHMADKQQLINPPALLSTHPGNEARLTRIRQFTAEHAPAKNNVLRPLPEYLKQQR